MSNVLFPSAELAPFVKRGGVADVAAALPKALRGLGHKVTVVVPRTGPTAGDASGFDDRGTLLARRLTPLQVKVGSETITVTVYDGRLSSQVDLCVLEWAEALAVPTLYDGNTARLAATFCGAIAELARMWAEAGNAPDVVHLNDWTTAPAAAKIAQLRAQGGALANVKTVLTVHSFAHQGVFPKEAFEWLGLPAEQFGVEGFEFHGKVNFLKGGLKAADAVTTVSPTYAREVATAERGEGLEGVIATLRTPLVGIVNGVDYSVWNPATDSSLEGRFDAEDASNKLRCKAAFVRERFGTFDPELPLVGFVGRLDAQKGIDTLLAALPKLLTATDAQFVLVGTGEAKFVKAATELAAQSMGRVLYLGHISEADVRRLFAAADVMVVPSRFEPCGLVQMYAQRYGAFPVANATGGLCDTLVDCDSQLETGTGFLYHADLDGDVHGLVAATERALAALSHDRSSALRRRIMRLDRGWERPARQIERLYSRLLA
jgi:starch synthase